MEAQSKTGYFLSPQQNYIWMAQQRSGAPLVTQITSIVEGALDESRLRQSFSKIAARHEILRTVFRRQPGMKTPFQVILDSCEPEWESAVASLESPEPDSFIVNSQQAFNFDDGPLVLVNITKLQECRYRLTVTISSLCSDAASLKTLLREAFTYYEGRGEENLVQEPLRYVQFAQWQSELLESDEDVAIEGREFWTQRTESNEQDVRLPFEAKVEAAGKIHRLSIPLDKSLLERIKHLAASKGASANEVLLAAWQSLLFRFSGSRRLAVGVVQGGREYEELVDSIGPIEKLLPVHARFEGSLRFREIISQTHEELASAIGCQEYLDPSKAFTSGPAIGFSYQEPSKAEQIGGVRYTVLDVSSARVEFKLSLNCIERSDGWSVDFLYDSLIYQETDIARISESYLTLLSAAIEDPEVEVARLPILSEAQRKLQLHIWNQTSTDYPTETMHALIERQVERTPERIAVRSGEQSLSYDQLNQQANRLAHHLRKLGVKADSLVGLCLDRSVEMMVAVLAILKAGGAYVSISADNPKARLSQQLTDAVALITDEKLFANMPDSFGSEPAGPVLKIDSDSHLWADELDSNPDAVATPENLVYVIYTSGSTGVPKGVGVRHRNLVNYTWAISKQLNLEKYTEGLQFATVSTLGADLGNTCIYPALLSGGTLHVIPYDVATDAHKFATYQTKYPIDVLKIVPSHLAALLDSQSGSGVLPRKYLITGGEILSRSLVEQIEALNSSCQIINHYGPTETTVGSLTQPLSGYQWKNSRSSGIPIGKPIANTSVYVLDQYLQPVPEGVVGELYIAGAGVSAGYLRQPERTAERFVPNPFVSDNTMYRTGDLSRFVPDGNGTVEFLGRTDDQVKIRGFRVELGEIESILVSQAGVKHAVVLARGTGSAGDKQLVGYVVAASGAQLSSEGLRSALRQQLPDYMVPSTVLLIEKLPLTTNGKIDRKALPSPDDVAAPKAYIAPTTASEVAVAKIWADVLQRTQISTDDNFFELGGHSLMATQVVSRIREQLAVSLALRTMFEFPVLKAFSEAVDAAKSESATQDSPIQRVARGAYRTSVPTVAE